VGKRKIGYAAAIFNGIWGGSIMVPLKFASKSQPKTGIQSVFFPPFPPQAILICHKIDM